MKDSIAKEKSGVKKFLKIMSNYVTRPFCAMCTGTTIRFMPDKHYCVNVNWIFCKYQPGFVNTNTNLQMPAVRTLQQLVFANYWMCVV